MSTTNTCYYCDFAPQKRIGHAGTCPLYESTLPLFPTCYYCDAPEGYQHRPECPVPEAEEKRRQREFVEIAKKYAPNDPIIGFDFGNLDSAVLQAFYPSLTTAPPRYLYGLFDI